MQEDQYPRIEKLSRVRCIGYNSDGSRSYFEAEARTMDGKHVTVWSWSDTVWIGDMAAETSSNWTTRRPHISVAQPQQPDTR